MVDLAFEKIVDFPVTFGLSFKGKPLPKPKLMVKNT